MRFDDPAIIERYRSPRHRATLSADACDASATGNNPFCGDNIELRIAVEPDADGTTRIAAASFDGHACSLCTATADLLCERVVGRPVAELGTLGLDELCVLWGGLDVGRARQNCVTLPATVLARACAIIASR